MLSEQWLPVPGLTHIQASDKGRIWSMPRLLDNGHWHGGCELAQTADKDGYMRVSTGGMTYAVHRLVLLAFRGPPRNSAHEALHKNDRRNDNRLKNLRWGSKSANAKQRERNRKRKRNRSLPLELGRL